MSRLERYTLPDGSLNCRGVYADAMQFGRDADLLDYLMRKLVRRKHYRNKWAAMQNGELTIAPTRDELLAKLSAQKKRNAAVRYLRPKPPRIILAKSRRTYH